MITWTDQHDTACTRCLKPRHDHYRQPAPPGVCHHYAQPASGGYRAWVRILSWLGGK